MNADRGPAPAFRALQRAIVRRRVEALEPVLRLELAAIAALAGGFVFWQARLPLDHAARAGGAPDAAGALAARLALLALAGAALAAGRHAWVLREGPPGPPWLALPIPPAALAGHLAWASSLHALWVAVPAVAVLAAGFGLVPVAWLAGLAAAFAAALWGLARAAIAATTALAVVAAEPRRGAPALHRVLARAPRRARGARMPAARFRGGPAWRAMARKDVRVTARPGPARARARAAAACAALAAAAWAPGLERGLAPTAGAALSLFAGALVAQWLVALAGADPPGIVRALPLGTRDMWGVRAGWAVAAALVLAALQAPALAALARDGAAMLLAVAGGGSLAVGLLGASLAVSLHPRTDHARRLLGLWLGLALAASLMIPLLGWVVLLAALAHALRRVPRWRAPEAA
uniref:Uncharacterized protein n=1 Tax=Eiseniibacteriota bacterium TaxID=2212470 RepID=A0A832MN22_UNCEI